MVTVAVNPGTQLIDLKTGLATRDLFLLLQTLTTAINQATSDYVTVDAVQTLTNKTITGYTATSGLVTLLVVDSISDGVTTKGASSNAVSAALLLKQTHSSNLDTWSGKTILSGTATYDPPSLADGAGATTTVTVTGATLGMMALVSFSLDLSGITVTAYVSAADTVSVRFQNESGGLLDLASGTLTAWAINS